MDMISALPDQMLVEILSRLPTRKVVATMVLSKRWKFLWKQLPKLDYDFNQFDGKNFSEFVTKSLHLQECQVLKSFKLSVSPYCNPNDVGNWIGFAVSRYVHDLEIDLSAARNPMITTLPKSLYTCETLTCLKLNGLVLEDIPEDYSVYLSSLQNLYLFVSVHMSLYKFLGKIMDGAPVLKKAVFGGCFHDNQFDYKKLLNGFIVCCSEWNPVGEFHFDNLEHLCICTCSFGWWNLLMVFLQRCPKLRNLEIIKFKEHQVPPMVSWNWNLPIGVSEIPQCLSSTLQTLEWRDYTNNRFDKAVASFLLWNSIRLNKAKIFPVPSDCTIKMLLSKFYS